LVLAEANSVIRLLFLVTYLVAFSWKQKLELRLDAKEKKKQLKMKPYGEMDELMEHFSVSRGDIEIPIGESFSMPERPPQNEYMVIDVSKLYGSGKPYGELFTDKPRHSSPFTKVRMSKGRPL
jgi:hypothetical protein